MSTVKEIDRMVRREGVVLTIAEDQSVTDAAIKMRANRIGCLMVVTSADRIAGIVSERDIITKIVAESLDPLTTPVSAIMTRNVLACTMNTPVARAQQIMASHGIRHLPIIDDGILRGMISGRDLLALQLSATEAIVRKQSKLLQELEQTHPGISSIQRDESGRVLI